MNKEVQSLIGVQNSVGRKKHCMAISLSNQIERISLHKMVLAMLQVVCKEGMCVSMGLQML